MFKVLFASDVWLRGLHRSMAKKKLDLFEFAAASMAETCATASKVVWCEIFDPGLFSTSFHRIPDYVGCHASALSHSISQNLSEHFSVAYARIPKPTIDKGFAPSWHRDSSNPSAFANQIDDYPVALPELQLFQPQSRDRIPIVAIHIPAVVRGWLRLFFRAGCHAERS